MKNNKVNTNEIQKRLLMPSCIATPSGGSNMVTMMETKDREEVDIINRFYCSEFYSTTT